ncbi:D-alanyl-D-alanine carboxypeptidase [Streptomyces sp. NPDC007205]|uniref:D-alanyl-D-alanine carboxypeptidase n=1 Tax=Streptomyces sp. NPDC007205 TaxID=3154316 RepID=UPI0033E060A9
MEEASVAGESPDRSKQRQSSAEPTSGSAGPVPEARDPRLAVSREKDSSSGGVDTATKILSIRETPEEDTALREAVSAWVRGADTPENDATADQNRAGNDTEKADAEANVKAKAEKKPDTDDEKAAAEAKAEPDSAADTDGNAETDAKTGTEKARTTKAGTTKAETTKAETTKAETTEGEADAKAEAGSVEADAKAETGEGEANAKAETGEGEADAKAEAGSVEADAKAEAGTAEGEADTKAEAGGAEAEAEAGGGEAEAEGDEGGPEDADGEDAPEGPPAADDETRTGGAGGNDTDAEGEAEAEGTHAAKAPHAAVDQPTTVFKAIPPKPAPQVDQPTTMLKLGSKPDTPRTPESDPERTSTFVALKNDMAPAAKPAAKPDVTTPVPQVGPERTTQQPLPPKPPLDLLAELTNTPPPPETPVRTIVRRVKIWTPLVLLLAVVFAVVQTLRPLPSPALALTARDSYTFDGTTSLPWPSEGQGWMDGDGIGTMGHFGKQTPVAIGSVAKTMTSYIILRDHPLKAGQEGPRIKVDPQAEKEGGYDKSGGESTLNTVKAGDHLTEKQALSAVMIPSANNIARLLARWDAGSEAAFVKKMNAAAKELGMTSTKYTDPSGLTPSTVSTAEDQVKLGRAVTKIPALVAITSAASWTDPTGHFWNNVNELPFRIGAIGIKTGSTTAAGGNLLFASRKQVGGQTVTIVGAILGQHRGTSILRTVNDVSKTALLAAQNALTSVKILKKGDVVGYVDDQLGGQTPVVLTKDVPAVGWAGLKVKLSFTSGKVPHTAKAGTRVGALTVGDGSAGSVKVPVALQKDLAQPGFGAKLTRLG